MQNPISSEIKDEILNIIKSVCVTFTTSYVKNYTIQLAKKLEEEAAQAPSPFLLLEREPPTDDLKAGYLTKEGAIRKNWKKRWFVVRHNYFVDYFADEKAAQKAKPKPKGTMSLAGYYVEEDPNKGALKSLMELAEKMGVDTSSLPKPKEYPEFCFEIKHSRRRCYYIKAQNQEEFNDWVSMFKTCCRNAWGLKNRDEVHEAAFFRAVRDTRWSLGRWGWCSYGGSEEQILSDLISDEIEWQTVGKILSRITGAWTLRMTIRNQALKAIDTMVSAGVSPAWKAMSATVEEIRPKVTPVIQKVVDPLGKAKQKIVDAITEAALSVINPAIEKHVNPHVGKIVDVITSPVKEAYDQSYLIWDKTVEEFGANADLKNPTPAFKKMDWARSYWNMRPATEKVDVMYDPLWLLHEVFTDIHPWTLIWTAHDELSQKMDNAVYTFQVELKEILEKEPEVGKDAIARAKTSVTEKYRHDAEIQTVDYYREIIKEIVMPPLNATLVPACKTVLEPIAETIPEDLKDFIDIMDMFDKVVDGIVSGAINTMLKATAQ